MWGNLRNDNMKLTIKVTKKSIMISHLRKRLIQMLKYLRVNHAVLVLRNMDTKGNEFIFISPLNYEIGG